MLMCGGCPIWGKQRIAGWEPFTTTPKGDRRTVAWTKLDAGLGIFPALVSIFFVSIYQNCYSWRCLSSCLTIEFCLTLNFLCYHIIHFCLIFTCFVNAKISKCTSFHHLGSQDRHMYQRRGGCPGRVVQYSISWVSCNRAGIVIQVCYEDFVNQSILALLSLSMLGIHLPWDGKLKCLSMTSHVTELVLWYCEIGFPPLGYLFCPCAVDKSESGGRMYDPTYLYSTEKVRMQIHWELLHEKFIYYHPLVIRAKIGIVVCCGICCTAPATDVVLMGVLQGYLMMSESAKFRHSVKTINISISAQHSCFGNR